MNNGSQYEQISKAIEIFKSDISKNDFFRVYERQTGLSRSEFGKLVKDWSGCTDEQFFEFINPSFNLQSLNEQGQTDLFQTKIQNFGPSPAALCKIIPISDSEFGEKGENLKINYEYYDSPFGKIIVASTTKGVCFMAFEDEDEKGLRDMKFRFYRSEFKLKKDDFQIAAASFFELENQKEVNLNMRGTDFQLKVWQELLKIPLGKLTTYNRLANQIGMPTASRAVGTAIGRNPITFIVPCHRVIQSGGGFGGYHWGTNRKMAIRIWELSAISK